jgi:hypothetical protein
MDYNKKTGGNRNSGHEKRDGLATGKEVVREKSVELKDSREDPLNFTASSDQCVCVFVSQEVKRSD